MHDKYDENQSRAQPPKPISAWSLWRSNGVIKSVKGSTQIEQYKKNIVSSISHYQQIIKYAKEGRLGAMTTSVRRLKFDMQTVCVEVYLQLVGNRSLKDLGQIG